METETKTTEATEENVPTTLISSWIEGDLIRVSVDIISGGSIKYFGFFMNKDMAIKLIKNLKNHIEHMK